MGGLRAIERESRRPTQRQTQADTETEIKTDRDSLTGGREFYGNDNRYVSK